MVAAAAPASAAARLVLAVVHDDGAAAAAATPVRSTWAPAAAPVTVAASEGALAHLLARADLAQASDVLLSSGQAPRLRVGGALVVLDEPATDDAAILALLAPVLDDARRAALDRDGSADAALAVATGDDAPRRYRVNLFRQAVGLAAALRPIRRDVPTLEQLRLPAELHQLTRPSSGLVLVTGRAGSGKSTTLVALIEHLNRTADKHVITLEDPIEYAYQPRRCLIHQREVGHQVDSFAAGLRAALRESPDVILVGELRDRETIAAALTAAETGHLVLATMHCASAALAVDRIIDVFPDRQQQQVRLQLAMTLRAVLTQVLVPSLAPPLRVPAHELMVVTPAVAGQIRDGKAHLLPSLIQTGRAAGMVPLERTLAALVRAHQVSVEAARDAAFDPGQLDQLLAGRA
ncbi:MAG: PilT/PilU family type 4a pilus ATPase [Kofleriaceae bacterium]|nr:PilT/PilU family type 4a pilus ATPase [Kofleriaceae bacterium]